MQFGTVVGKYAPEVVARDVTNSMNSNNYSSPGLLPYTPSNSGLITYTPSNSGLLNYISIVSRTNYIYVNDSTAGGTIINQVGLNGWKPTVLPSNSGDPILMPDFPLYPNINLGGKLVQLDTLHTAIPDKHTQAKGVAGGHNEESFNNYILDKGIRINVLSLSEV